MRQPGTREQAAGGDLDAAHATMGADELREVVREMMADLDDRAHERAVSSIMGRAVRNGAGWAPPALDDNDIVEAVTFAEAARQVGYAHPWEVDERLRRGVSAFLRRDYAGALRILGALLGPLGDGEIDLGQDEMADEVLGVDLGECAAFYVVSSYMTAEPARRAETVRTAIGDVCSHHIFRAPIQDMERAAVEVLPGLDDFLSQWRHLVENEAGTSEHGWDAEADAWRREVVLRLEGPDGLAHLARSTKGRSDLRAWCESLALAKDWTGALAAFEESAEFVAGSKTARAEFLDGAALAARESGEQDISSWLLRAWQADPTLARLLRWLGAAQAPPSVRDRARPALEACPHEALKQRAFLHVLLGEIGPAARLLADAPGLGWSEPEHPGPLLFPLFEQLLGEGGRPASGRVSGARDFYAGDPDPDDGPRLVTPGTEEVLRGAGIESVPASKDQKTVLWAMRVAAGKRVADVTGQKRRKSYGHAGSLVASCVACDGSGETARWVRALREQYRRFPAFCAELDGRLRSA